MLLPRFRGRTHSYSRGGPPWWLVICPPTRRGGRWWAYFTLAMAVAAVLVIHLVREVLDFYFAVDINQVPHSSLGPMYTVRVNTFRRNDLLKPFLQHFVTCPHIKAIQVVWSDQKNEPPPLSWFDLPSPSWAQVLVERHPVDSLNNRFKALLPIETEGVLSIDDDLIISCDDLDVVYQAWQSSPQALVGVFPRLATLRPDHQGYLYHATWSMVWWQGLYNIILTKCCFLHRDLLAAYHTDLSPGMLSFIQGHRNCEDIAMQFVASNRTGGTPPVWVSIPYLDKGSVGISSGKRHGQVRGDCVTKLVKEFGRDPLTISSIKVVSACRRWFGGKCRL